MSYCKLPKVGYHSNVNCKSYEENYRIMTIHAFLILSSIWTLSRTLVTLQEIHDKTSNFKLEKCSLFNITENKWNCNCYFMRKLMNVKTRSYYELFRKFWSNLFIRKWKLFEIENWLLKKGWLPRNWKNEIWF